MSKYATYRFKASRNKSVEAFPRAVVRRSPGRWASDQRKIPFMLSFLPGPVRGALTLLIIGLSTLVCILVLYTIAALKLLLPFNGARRIFNPILTRTAGVWVSLNNCLFPLMHRMRWDINGVENLRRDRWYLVCCNHQSGADIPVLQKVFHRRIPFIRFFIKRQLLWMPFLGLAWKILDYPFVNRHSQEYLQRHPHRREEDLATIRKACARFKDAPTSILNFAEGTRLTRVKQIEQGSPYLHLLRPKAGGMALALASMGEMFSAILDVTILYPHRVPRLWDLLCGRVERVVVHVRHRPVPGEFLSGDYAGDPQFRERFKKWLNELWRQKDDLMGVILDDEKKRTRGGENHA